ncbi:TonB-dependent receptor domain-containing protein [Microbulbifer spongiae]|uniref:TonB-dependent receptor n=1 Tax=Microbulbifer spongiae TaxID=2944933 RepID=A0ABY9EEL0_9GAMM|nr:TonB-dependent receptor [Microbulbifer sp. MI-G]WKD51463.1 TonB-dependent receptor [Microbulbifer sp. MI-G]
MNSRKTCLASAISLTTLIAANQSLAEPADDGQLEEVVVLGTGATFNSSAVSEAMRKQQSSITSVNALIDNLPGVSVNEGDAYGFDDWSTNISVRGFTISLDEQQIGTTIDGIPNGGSNYGGGAKANRFIDPANLASIEVSQGTSDIASRSLDALGGTIDYRSQDPVDTRRSRMELSAGEFDARRFYYRFDTGTFAGNSKAWISYANQEATDWITETAQNEREHIAAKLVTTLENGTVNTYVSYDDIHENNYQRIYSETQFKEFPEDDFLRGKWVGIPYIDQLYRRGWSTLRKNLLAYSQFEYDLTERLNLHAGLYYHTNSGRGDWVPPYLVDITDDGNAGQSEFLGGSTAYGGLQTGQIFYVDANGNALTPIDGCISSVVNIYGQSGPEYDPACYPANAIPVMSYRHTHYKKKRTGLIADFTYNGLIAGFEHELRGGLWYEDATRDEHRDWHKITDATRSADFDAAPYWVQYDRSYPQETRQWYLQDALVIDAITLTLGAKQFFVDVQREDFFGASPDVGINSDSDILISAGLLWATPLENTELFAGYAENFKAIGDSVLERPDSDLDNIDPETSETIELGLRYTGDSFTATATYFENQFENRIIFLDNNTTTGPNYLIGTNGTYFNAGGIESNGLELLLDYDLGESFNLYTSYTLINATYLGSGDAAVDEAQGITPGNTVVGIPEQLFVVGLDWNSELLYGGVSSKFTGDRYVDTNNTWVADAYITTDAYIGINLIEINPALTAVNLNLVVNNLFDTDYLGTVVSGGAWIGAPRTLSLSASVDF